MPSSSRCNALTVSCCRFTRSSHDLNRSPSQCLRHGGTIGPRPACPYGARIRRLPEFHTRSALVSLNHLPCDTLSAVEEHEEAGRFVPLQHIAGRGDVGKLISEIGGILRDRELIRIGQHALSEMTRNVIEHAYADGFVCAQYYPANKHISIGVADCGRGIRRSLEEAYGFPSDGQAILGALRPGVSGRSRRPYGAADNAGLGLFVARALAKASHQYFMVASGDSAFRLPSAV
jgi:anti-sigma regulatory factor (Ser/Thr protein kinase)